MSLQPRHSAGHRARLRSRTEADPQAMADYEMMELLLGYVLRRKDTKPLAKDLLERFSSITGIINAHPAELTQMEGAGPALGFFLLLEREIIARYLEGQIKNRNSICSPRDVALLARCRLSGIADEEVWVALLDNGNRLLTFERISKGTVDLVLFHPRMLLELALKRKASAAILVHNHPGGSITPSVPDLEMTHKLADAVRAVDVRFLDHLIIADDKCYSLLSDRLLDLS